MVLPDDLLGDVGSRDLERGAAAAKRVGAGGREIDRGVIGVVGIVARAAVSRGHAEGHAHRGGVLEDLVDLVRRGIGGFSAAPQLREITVGL